MAKSVTIYTTPTCSWCMRVKQYFKENKVKYTEKDVTTDQKALEALIKKSGQTAVPVIDIDGTIIIGFDKPALAEAIGI